MTETVNIVVSAAREAQREALQWTQAQADRAVAAVAWHSLTGVIPQQLARLSVSETGLGSYEDSLKRLHIRIRGLLTDLHGISSVGLIKSEASLGLAQYAKPVGVIGVFTPATAPVAAILMNVLNALKTRNSVVLCPNPSTLQTTRATVDAIHRGLDEIGAPRDLVQIIGSPDRAMACELAAAVDLVIATGGAETVRRVTSAGTPAYSGGPGNAVVIVDATADLERAAALITEGKSFDNGTSCSAESSVVVIASVWDAFIEQLERHGGHICTFEEGQRLRQRAYHNNQTRRDVVGRSAREIADLAGLSTLAPRFLAAELWEQLEDDPLSGEKLSPILALCKVDHFECAVQTVRRLTSISGKGHSCGIHTSVEENISMLADAVDLTRVMVNQSTGQGNSGSLNNNMPFTTTLTCGTWANSLASENISWKRFVNRTWVSRPVKRRTIDWQELMVPFRSECVLP